MTNPSTSITTDHTAARRGNLIVLMREYVEQYKADTDAKDFRGVEQAFARHIGVSPSVLSQLKKSRAISNKLARQIENIFKRPLYWMDQPSQEPSSAELAFVAMAREVWLAQNAQGKRSLAKVVRDFGKM